MSEEKKEPVLDEYKKADRLWLENVYQGKITGTEQPEPNGITLFDV